MHTACVSSTQQQQNKSVFFWLNSSLQSISFEDVRHYAIGGLFV